METDTVTKQPANVSMPSFEAGLRRILSVSKEEMLRREAAYKQTANENPKKRGPKKKVKA